MEIVSIFANCLYAIRYNDGESDEFARLFDAWQDVEYLEDFFERNRQDLESGFYEDISIEEAISRTLNEARWLEGQLLDLYSLTPEHQSSKLEILFKPLDNSVHSVGWLGRTKAKGNQVKGWIRIYALKICSNCYVITGGAIKLTAKMDQREHTLKELRKLNRCKDYFRDEGLIDEQSFKELEL